MKRFVHNVSLCLRGVWIKLFNPSCTTTWPCHSLNYEASSYKRSSAPLSSDRCSELSLVEPLCPSHSLRKCFISVPFTTRSVTPSTSCRFCLVNLPAQVLDQYQGKGVKQCSGASPSAAVHVTLHLALNPRRCIRTGRWHLEYSWHIEATLNCLIFPAPLWEPIVASLQKPVF